MTERTRLNSTSSSNSSIPDLPLSSTGRRRSSLPPLQSRAEITMMAIETASISSSTTSHPQSLTTNRKRLRQPSGGDLLPPTNSPILLKRSFSETHCVERFVSQLASSYADYLPKEKSLEDPIHRRLKKLKIHKDMERQVELVADSLLEHNISPNMSAIIPAVKGSDVKEDTNLS